MKVKIEVRTKGEVGDIFEQLGFHMDLKDAIYEVFSSYDLFPESVEITTR